MLPVRQHSCPPRRSSDRTRMESGPVAGVIAAGCLGESLNCLQIISFDMGGTTAKSSLIKDFHPEVTSSYYVGGYVTGHPMMLPVVDIEIGRASCRERVCQYV